MNKKRQMSETLLIGSLLACVGGFLDAYSYLCRGEVFANAQTGNIVLLGVQLIEGNIHKVVYYLFPILAFIVGIFISEIIRKHYLSHPKIHWRQIILMIEVIVLCVVSFIPIGDMNAFCNIAISFVCSLQVESFRHFYGNPYATTMCTGNLRSASEHLYHYFHTREKRTLLKSLNYYIIILFFVLGASLGALFINMFSYSALLIGVALLIFIIIFMSKEQVG